MEWVKEPNQNLTPDPKICVIDICDLCILHVCYDYA